jgi:3',5'-cyclic AMP phosphodiesterase CpdA
MTRPILRSSTATAATLISATAIFLTGTSTITDGFLRNHHAIRRPAYVPHPKLLSSSDVGVGMNSESQSDTINGQDSSSMNGLDNNYNFVVGILGDLHIDPRKMEDYEIGREHWLSVFNEAKETAGPDHVALVSLGDLGESKNCDHNAVNPAELFAGTTLCHTMAAEYLTSFGVPYEVIGGNHDLEGIDEFKTDAANLHAFLKIHQKPTPHFVREIANRTLLVGLGSTVFRDARYTSHEVIIDQEQIKWFEQLLEDHPADAGWKIFVFSHAPPNGSGLRVLQENHVINGCCWLNHSDERNCRKFIELVRTHRCIKAWFSGHFHLGQDYQDSITFPTIDPKDGPYPNRGSCVFAQTSVIRSGASRDGRQQSRLLRIVTIHIMSVYMHMMMKPTIMITTSKFTHRNLTMMGSFVGWMKMINV